MTRAAALVLLLALGALGRAETPARQQTPGADDGVSVDEIEKDYLDRLGKAQDARDWRTFFAHVQKGLQSKATKVVSIGKDRWVGLREFLCGRIAALPPEALEHYRLHHDGPAAAEFARARATGTRRDLERAADVYFFASAADEVIDGLAQAAFDEGRAGEAASLWLRLLRHYPDPDAPRALLVARAALACRAAADENLLADLRAWVAEKKVAGTVHAAGRDTDLQAFLGAVEIVPAPPPAPAAREPWVRTAVDRERRGGVANDIKRWTYDFASDRGEASAEPPAQPNVQRRGRVILRNDPNTAGTAPPDYPYFPAYAKVRGRDYVVFTDGTRVLAVDPGRVRPGSAASGVYWKYPADRSILRGGAVQGGAYGRPYAGAAVDGEHAFVTMYSRLDTRPREGGGQDPFEGLTAIKCLHLPSGRVVWDTDLEPLLTESKKLAFYEKAFSYTGPPVVSGDRVFVGVSSSPNGEQESWVLCLDRATGRAIWSTPIATLAAAGGGRMAMFMGRASGALYQTTLLVQGGLVYVQTNIGAVAALGAVTGDIRWLSRYPRSGLRTQNTGMADGTFIRGANWPVAWKGRLYLLPQDRPDLLSFEASTGRPAALPPLRVLREERPVEMRELHQLLGVVNDWLVIGGMLTHVIRLKDFTAFTLAASDTHASGRGAIQDGQVYLPVCSTGAGGDDRGGAGGPQTGVLGVYAPPPSWRCTGQTPWKGPAEYGNLLVAGDYLVVATDKLSVYTEVETLRREYAHRLAATPPRADVLLEYGDAMRENDRLEEAAEAYLGFIRAAEGDPRWDARSRQVRRDLHAIFLRRGDETADPARALELFAYAKSFAYDEASRAEATRRLAGTYEKASRWKEAVGQYQELIERARSHYHRQGEEVRKLWQHARERVDDIVRKSPEAYEEVEKRAAEALAKAREGGEEALRGVLDRFPNSKSARDAWNALRDRLRLEGGLERLRGLYKDFEERFKESLDFDAHKDLLELLEKLKDGERMRFELDRFEARFGGRTVGEEAVAAWVARKRAALASDAPGPRTAKPGPATLVGQLDPFTPPGDAQAAGGGLRPLQPAGAVPAGMPSGADVFARGSSVELWDVAGRARLWARPKFGVWAGFSITEKDVVSLVAADSPAERAGMRKDDVLVSIDGLVGAEAAQQLLASKEPGMSVEALVLRAGKEQRLKLELAPPPAELAPRVLGAAWTRDGSLAVVWEDGVQAFDPATGAPRWIFRDVASGAEVRSFRAVEGRLVLYEDDREERRKAAPDAKAAGVRARVLALNDFTGDVAWAYAMDVEPLPQGGVESEARLFGRPTGPHVGVLQTVTRGGNREEYLWTFRSDAGGKPEKRSLPGRLAAHAVDEERGIFYAVCEVSDRQDRILLSRSLDADRKDFKAIDIPLKATDLAPPGVPSFALAAEGDVLCLLGVAGPETRLRVFKGGQAAGALTLPEGRTLPPQGKPTARLEGGVLAVYTVPKDAGGEPRAFLTAYRAASGELLWDAPAPVAGSSGAQWSIDGAGGRLLVLSSPQGAPPGRPAEGGVAAVYDLAAEGYLRLVRSPLAGAPDPVLFSRGRLYILGREKTDVYVE
jgi:outer membrane protein assembly factor BamB/tetratricopeptide (TPR) repeat protein